MSDWSPEVYRRYEDERTRPARDLLAQVRHPAPRLVVDLGCGPGNSTELLIERWPAAAVIALDSSPAMIAAARARVPTAQHVLADVATWTPDAAPDVIFANATLQWVPAHLDVMARLVAQLAPGGVLAVQLPDNLDEPSHRLMDETAAAGPYAARLAGAQRPPLPSIDACYDALRPLCARLDLWLTHYHHPLASPAAIVEWVSSTGLRRFLDALSPPEQAAFRADYQARLARAYPPRIDGAVLLRYPRRFVIAERA